MTKLPRPLSIGEELLAQQLKAYGVEFNRQYVFHPGRKWRFDFQLPLRYIAIEVEGGLFVKGRHSRGKSYEADLRKYNQATINGYRLLRYSTDMVKSGEAIKQIMEFIE